MAIALSGQAVQQGVATHGEGWSRAGLLPSLRSAGSQVVSSLLHSFVVLSLLALGGLPLQAFARPVVCTTSLEAPGSSSATGPVEVTRCGPVERTDTLVENLLTTGPRPMPAVWM